SMANSVMLEKTSKLMETILTAVHPVALMTGKLLATACAAIIQITVWMIAAAGGLIGTLVVVVTMLPNLADIAQNVSMPGGDTAEKAAQLAESLNGNLPHISVAGIFVTLIVMALGFLLYLAVATVSGAMASKQEDLNKTIGIFSIVLVVSVLVCLRPEISEVSGSFSLISNDKWLRFVPFTALLVLPADLIFGKLTVPETILALFSLAASVMLLIWLAAAVYKLLVLYRGNPPKIRQLIGMLRGSRNGKTDT
nr:ABC transporter permease [Oscillospiraceae bacterium]